MIEEVREARLELADSYESGYLLYMTLCFYVILSPPPLTGLGYSRIDSQPTGACPLIVQVTKALLNALAAIKRWWAAPDLNQRPSIPLSVLLGPDSRCKRDIIAGLD
jgi:hypothetical protein